MRITRPAVVGGLLALALSAALLPGVSAAAPAGAPPGSSSGNGKPADAGADRGNAQKCRADKLDGLELPGAEITGVEAVLNEGTGTLLTPPIGSEVPGAPFCEIEVSLTHGQEGTQGLPADDVHVWLWLPLDWNGRLQATGGGGTKATNGPSAMVPALAEGYAVTASDSGISVTNPRTNIFLEGNEFNWQLFENWTWRGVHENAVIAKAVVDAFYGKPAEYAYWNGCSNGGRQGMAAVQRFPDDFDGVLAGAPAMYGAERLNMTMSWPAFLQNDAFGGFIQECKLAAMTQTVRDACDGLDGIADGLVSNPGECDYATALQGLIGTELVCGTITAEEVQVVTKIFEGPHTSSGQFVWYGHTPGVDLTGGAITFHDGWSIRNFIKHDPAYDWTTSTTEELIEVFSRQYREGRLDLLSSSSPVLEPFAQSGGKLLVWHGLADGLFPADQSVHYYEQVRTLSGDSTDDFFRLFLAPGVDHCGGGTGPAPADPLAALVAWVEEGVAPEDLPAVQLDESGAVVRERDLCAYPAVQVYDGEGDPDVAASFSCGPAFPSPAS